MTVFVEEHYVRLQTDVTLSHQLSILFEGEGCMNELGLALVRSIDHLSAGAQADVLE